MCKIYHTYLPNLGALCGFVTHINKLVAILRDISPTLINKK